MITFLDGPAVNCKGLRLGRTPFFLRVVYNPKRHSWDALDQPGDKPEPGEEIIVYELASKPLRGFFRPGGLRVFASYRLHDKQPAEEDVRSNARWSNWVEQRAGELRGDPLDDEDATEPIDYGLDTGSQ